MGLKRGIVSFEWRCAYERVKEGGKKTTDRLFTAGAHRTTGRFVELFSPLSLSLCASAFVIFSAEKKRKEKGEKKKIGQLLATVTVLITTNSISFN